MATAKFEGFISALEKLCREHKVQIATSDYDTIQIWDLKDGEEPIYGGSDGVVDRTE